MRQNSWLKIAVGAANKTCVKSFKGGKKTNWLSVLSVSLGYKCLQQKVMPGMGVVVGIITRSTALVCHSW